MKVISIVHAEHWFQVVFTGLKFWPLQPRQKRAQPHELWGQKMEIPSTDSETLLLLLHYYCSSVYRVAHMSFNLGEISWQVSVHFWKRIARMSKDFCSTWKILGSRVQLSAFWLDRMVGTFFQNCLSCFFEKNSYSFEILKSLNSVYSAHEVGLLD